MNIERQFYYGDYGYPLADRRIDFGSGGGGYCCERKADIITVLGKKLFEYYLKHTTENWF